MIDFTGNFQSLTNNGISSAANSIKFEVTPFVAESFRTCHEKGNLIVVNVNGNRAVIFGGTLTISGGTIAVENFTSENNCGFEHQIFDATYSSLSFNCYECE